MRCDRHVRFTRRPIRNIAAESEFCEVFFDDVRVPKDNLVGELNQGWTVAKALLGFERLFTGSPKHSQHTLHQVEKLAAQRGRLAAQHGDQDSDDGCVHQVRSPVLAGWKSLIRP